MQSYELCSDMIDVCIDVECIYGYVKADMFWDIHTYIYIYLTALI